MRNTLIACLTLAVGIAACAIPNQQPRQNQNNPTVKIVDAKMPPGTLYAVDRSVCLVTVERFRRIRVGDAVYCRWRGGDALAPAPLAPGEVTPAPLAPGEVAPGQ